MKPNLKFNNLPNLFFYLLLTAAIVVLTVVFFMPNQNRAFDSEDCYTLNDSCSLLKSDGTKVPISLPTTVAPDENGAVTVEYIIPQNTEKLYAFCIRTSNQSLEVECDGKLIYTYGMDKSKIAIGKSPGSCYNIIRLPIDAGGKSITFKITAFDSFFSGHINEILAGTKAAILFYLLKKNWINMMVAAVIFVVGICLLIGQLIFRKVLKGDNQLKYIGWFATLVGLWLFAESKTGQFYIGNQLVIYFLAFLSFMLFAIPIFQYLLTIESYHYKKIVKALIAVISLDTITVTALQLTNVFQFYEMTLWTQMIRVLAVIIVLITLVLEIFKHKNKKMTIVSIAVIILGLGAVFEVIKFQLARGENVGAFVKVGTLAFVIILSCSAINHSIYVAKLSGEARYYKFMAKMDLMTGIKNRSAYINDMEAIAKTDSFKECAIVIADINELKTINDCYGHDMGDDAIIRCSNCMTDIFKGIGECYRIGGDEFACIIPKCDGIALDDYISKLERKCTNVDKDCSYAFDVAAGYGIFDENRDIEIEDIQRTADKNMYSRKEALKMQKNTAVLN